MKHLMTLGLMSAALAAPLAAQAADMLGDTLTFTRAYPTTSTPYTTWDPVSRTTTVTADDSDLIAWSITAVPGTPVFDIDPDADTIDWYMRLGGVYELGNGIFDGFVITGFDNDIASVTVLSNTTGRLLDVSHTAREIHIGLDGAFPNDAGFVLGVTVVPEPGTWALWLAGLAAVGAVARRRQR